MSKDLVMTPSPDHAPPSMSPDQADLPPASPEDLASPSWSLGRVVRRVLPFALVVETFAIGLLYVPIPPNPDHECYDLMAWTALDQGGFYRNAGDMNMPGEPLLHVASMAAFGNHIWSYRLLDFLLLVAFSGATALAVRRYFGGLYGAIFFGMYPIIYATSGYWMTGQRDLLATHLVLLAGFAYLRRAEGGTRAWLVASASMIAAATLLKPTYLAFAPLMLVVELPFARRDARTWAVDVAVMAAVGASALGLVVLVGWATGSLDDWYEMTVLYSSQNYIGGMRAGRVFEIILTTAIRHWHWYTIMALSGLVCWIAEPRKAPLAIILAAAITVLASTFTQRKGFGYHFGGLLAPATLLCSFYLAEAIRFSRKIPDPRLRFSVLSFPALIVLGGLVSKAEKEFSPQVEWYLGRLDRPGFLQSRGFADVVEAADYARSATTPDQTVWTLSTHVMLNSLADRRMPYRLVSGAMLRASKPTPLADRWRREVESLFRDSPPAFVVLESVEPKEPDRFQYMDDIRPDEPISALEDALRRSYVPDRRIGRFAFFRRADAAVARTDGTSVAGGAH